MYNFDLFAEIYNIQLPTNVTNETKKLFIQYNSVKQRSASKKKLAELRKQMYAIEIPRIQTTLPEFSEFKKAITEHKFIRIVMETLSIFEKENYDYSDYEKRISENSFYHKKINFNLKLIYWTLKQKKILNPIVDFVLLKMVEPIDIIYFEQISGVSLSLFTSIRKTNSAS